MSPVRQIQVQMLFTQGSGANDGGEANDGYADNLSLALTYVVPEPASMSMLALGARDFLRRHRA